MQSETWTVYNNLQCLWQEDDACRAAGDNSRERVHEAWRRIFGEDFPGQGSAIAKHDGGDSFLFLFPGGKVFEFSFMGEAIYLLKQEETKAEAVPENTSRDFGKVSYEPSEEAGVPKVDPYEEDSEEDERDKARYDGIVLSPDQRKARDAILDAIDHGERVMVLKGPAGTGKTTLAIALSHELTDRKWQIRYMAPTGKAAVRLADVVKRPATTIHSALFKSFRQTEEGVPIFDDPQQLAMGKTAIFCDEGSMVGSRLFSKMLEYLGPQTIMLVMGDSEQLPPVADKWGPDFDNPTAELTQIHRQAADNPIIRVATDVRMGKPMPKESVGKEFIRQEGDLQLAAAWMKREIEAGNSAIVLCFSNATRQKINTLTRMLLGYRKRGELVQGEHLVVLKNNRFAGKMNGETFVANDIRPMPPRNGEPDQGVVVIRTSDSAMFTKPKLIGADQISFERHVAMASTYTEPKLWVQLDYAYALTVHKSQGNEWKKVLFVIDSTMRNMVRSGMMSVLDAKRLCYTAITRAREQVIVLDVK